MPELLGAESGVRTEGLGAGCRSSLSPCSALEQQASAWLSLERPGFPLLPTGPPLGRRRPWRAVTLEEDWEWVQGM